MKVAVVGSGVSGLAATWLLNEHSDHTVHLYEADSRPGGHANTVKFPVPGDEKKSVDVDTGFIVFNPTTYPNFLRFLRMHDSLKDLVTPTGMTFSVSRDNGDFEWAGKNLFTVFCQPKNILKPEMWRLMWDVARFNATAGKVLLDAKNDESVGSYLDRKGYSSSFRDDYLIPMTAAIWSTPPDKCALDFPARTLIQFLHNHHLLQITGKPSWLTIKGGSQNYVKQILSRLDNSRLHLSSPVTSVTRLPVGQANKSSQHKLLLRTSTGASEVYDHVILACHSDEAMRILRSGEGIEGGTGITQAEEDLLGKFMWNKNEAVLHADVGLMPKSRLAWSCWNYLTQSSIDEDDRVRANSEQVSLTYGMNDLQHISESQFGPVLVTLNPPFEPRPELTVGRWKYDHPVLDGNAVRAQRDMHTIQGVSGVSFAGAYLRYGFHEDGFTSGLVAAAKVADVFGDRQSVRPPFDIEFASKALEWTPRREFIAMFFDQIEDMGIRAAMGWLGSLALATLGLILLQV